MATERVKIDVVFIDDDEVLRMYVDDADGKGAILKIIIKTILIATVLVIIKLTKFAVALRLRCGSCKLIF